MARPPLALLIVLIACALDPAGRLAADTRPLRVAAVQLSIHPEDLASPSAFRARIEGLVAGCLPAEPDLILFPEYTSAFLALVPYGAQLQDADNTAEALRRVRAVEPLARGLRDLFLLNAGVAEAAARELFGGLARHYRVAVGAGTLFAAEREAQSTRLVNRALVFGRDGELLHAQDKVMLTEYEEEALGLEAGSLDRTAPFLLDGRRVGLTICRDTYLAEWERLLAGCDLWVDLKGNGGPFTEQTREHFRLALPARLGASEVRYGLTVCLTGRLWELAWEGESFLAVRGSDGRVRTAVRAASPTGEELLWLGLPFAR
jgi:predicted amidohydrolase